MSLLQNISLGSMSAGIYFFTSSQTRFSDTEIFTQFGHTGLIPTVFSKLRGEALDIRKTALQVLGADLTAVMAIMLHNLCDLSQEQAVATAGLTVCGLTAIAEKIIEIFQTQPPASTAALT